MNFEIFLKSLEVIKNTHHKVLKPGLTQLSHLRWRIKT